MDKEEILRKAKQLYIKLSGQLSSEEIEPFGRLIGLVQNQIEKYDGETKASDDLTFTLNYSDGTKKLVDEGVLFSINSEETMDIHIGVDKAWKLFGVQLCLNDFIKGIGLEKQFEKYLDEMSGK